jgi:hypothetical protein
MMLQFSHIRVFELDDPIDDPNTPLTKFKIPLFIETNYLGGHISLDKNCCATFKCATRYYR